MKNLSVMLKPASGMCNMRCEYCFYADVAKNRETPNYGKMSMETAYGIVDNVFSQLSRGDSITFAFQGGEPTLAGLSFFEGFFSHTKEKQRETGVRADFALQTNGYVIDDNWCKLLIEYPVLVGLSVDGYKQIHDSYRKDSSGGDTFNRIMQAKRLFDKYKVQYNILTVLTGESARHARKIWKFVQTEKIDFIQFIPCLGELEGEPALHALTPERSYRFYADLFPLWVQSLREGEYISVKLFDDLVNYYLRGIPTACGINGRCNIQLVAESDGSVFPCDFYMLDKFRMGSLAQDSLSEIYKNGERFLTDGKAYNSLPPCSKCKYQKSCNGGCKRMRDNMYISKGVCYYSKLLDEILQPLVHIGRQLIAGEGNRR